MASTTKIMTALLILENNNPDSSVSFSSYACSMPKVHLGVRPGETFKTKDLLYSLFLNPTMTPPWLWLNPAPDQFLLSPEK